MTEHLAAARFGDVRETLESLGSQSIAGDRKTAPAAPSDFLKKDNNTKEITYFNNKFSGKYPSNNYRNNLTKGRMQNPQR